MGQGSRLEFELSGKRRHAKFHHLVGDDVIIGNKLPSAVVKPRAFESATGN